MSHDKSPIDHVLDVAVFAPLGLALTVKDTIPDWVDTGRRRLLHHVEVARLVGEHATRHGQKRLAGTLVAMGILPGPPPPPSRRAPTETPASAPAAASAPGPPLAPPPRPVVPASANNGVAPPPPAGTAARGPAADHGVPAPRGPVPETADLAIPGYDSLSASQVVPRLAGLSPAELDAVAAYEAACRGRRTILTKISQLQTGRV